MSRHDFQVVEGTDPCWHRRTRSSYVSSWLTFLRTHELVGEHRLKFAAQLGEMSDELNALGKEVDKNRKAAKELASKLEKGLQEQEALVDRVRCLNRVSNPSSLALLLT